MSTKKETPMMAQYRSIRRSLPEEIILFFRLGDFYEMFFDDSVRSASILDITLTKRNEVPMCGVPYHAAASYLEQLIKAEVKVSTPTALFKKPLTFGLGRPIVLHAWRCWWLFWLWLVFFRGDSWSGWGRGSYLSMS